MSKREKSKKIINLTISTAQQWSAWLCSVVFLLRSILSLSPCRCGIPYVLPVPVRSSVSSPLPKKTRRIGDSTLPLGVTLCVCSACLKSTLSRVYSHFTPSIPKILIIHNLCPRPPCSRDECPDEALTEDEWMKFSSLDELLSNLQNESSVEELTKICLIRSNQTVLDSQHSWTNLFQANVYTKPSLGPFPLHLCYGLGCGHAAGLLRQSSLGCKAMWCSGGIRSRESHWWWWWWRWWRKSQWTVVLMNDMLINWSKQICSKS